MKYKKLGFILRCGVSVVLLGYVLCRIQWGQTWQVLTRLDPAWAIAGSLMVPVLIGLLALRWKIFLSQADLEITFRKTFLLTWMGQFFNSILPGSTGGDLFKIYQICLLNPTRKMLSTATVVADRVSALVALILLMGIAFFKAPSLVVGFTDGEKSWTLSPLFLTGVVLLFLSALVCVYLAARSVFLREHFLHLWKNLRQVIAFNAVFFKATVLSLLVHCFSFLGFFLFARSLGISLTYLEVLIMMPLILFIVLLPITVNGHGLREIVMIYFFKHLDIATGSVGISETVVALSVVMITNELLWNMPMGIWYLCRNKSDPKGGAN